jgi:hypothetical protein
MRSSTLIAATLAGVASAHPYHPSVVGTAGTGGIFPSGNGGMFPTGSGGIFPTGTGPVSIPSGVFPPTILPTGTSKPYASGSVSLPSGVYPPQGTGMGIGTGTGIGGSLSGHLTLPPATITITSNVPATTTKTVEVVNTIITTVGKSTQPTF